MPLRRLVLAAVAALGVTLAAPRLLQAQGQGTGRIVGRVVESAQGAPIAGAQVEVVGAGIRAISALDGRYTLLNVPAGPVSIGVRMIGYQPKTVTGVVVPAGGAVPQDVALSTAVVQLEEVAVTAEAERGTVNRALDEQRNATQIVNAISAEQIARSPDSDAGQAVQRVSGVTVQDGKYVFVRGLGERYTTTSLNGVRIPSPEPERKVVPLDLFPSGLLEGITTSKTFTPDQPGDFSGAQVNLKTKEFPLGRVINFSVSAALNDAAFGKSSFKAPTVGSEWLGFAGGERKLPAPIREAGTLGGSSTEQINDFVGMFRKAWSANRGDGTANGGFGLSLGGEDPMFGQLVGYTASLTYSNAQEIRQEETKGLVVCDNLACSNVRRFNTYQGAGGRRSVLWGGILNLSTRLGATSRVSLNNAYTRSADNEAAVLVGRNEEFDQFGDLTLTRLVFTERVIRSNQLQGEHLFGDRHVVDWSVSNSHVGRNEPDRSDLAYGSRNPATGAPTAAYWLGISRSGTRTFADLSEDGWDLAANYRRFLGMPGRSATVKLGGAFRRVDRDADTRVYEITNRTLTAAELAAPPEQVFTAERAENGSFSLAASVNGGRYEAKDQVAAGYGQIEVPLSSRLQLIGGVRVENWRLDVTTVSVFGAPVSARPRKTDVLPALALTYRLTEDQNLRLSATQTLSRPEYRELSPVPYFEQIGHLTTIGNPDLKRALIQNLDARWEWFPNPGEVLSFGVFAKWFDDPIEKIIVQQAGGLALGFTNANSASNYGVELEVRKELGTLSEGLTGFSIFANSTLMRSRIEPGSEVLTNADRPMVGQSEYVVNAGLSYGNASGSFGATILYNVAGRRIIEAGAGGLLDAYEEARHLVDATLRFPIAGTLSGKLEGKNLLDAPFRVSQGGIVRHRYLLGRSFGIGFSWQP